MLAPTICSAPSPPVSTVDTVSKVAMSAKSDFDPPLFDVPKCRSALAKVLRRILGPQHRQLFRRPIRKGPEQNRIQDAEHGGVGANRQRQCGGGGRVNAGLLRSVRSAYRKSRGNSSSHMKDRTSDTPPWPA